MAPKKYNLLSKVLWFEKRLKFDIDFFDILMPQRIVSEHPRYKSGVFFSEKCQREIQYESGIELAFIKSLEQNKKVKFYWEQPVQIPYWRGRRKNAYTPDFALYLHTKEIVIVEIKTLTDMLDDRVQMKMEGLIKFCHRRGFGLLLTDGKLNLDKLKKGCCNRKLEKTILNQIQESRVIKRKQCKEIMKQCNATQTELLKCIIRHNLKFRSRIFKLEKENKNSVFRHVFIHKKAYDDLLMERFETLFQINK